jgi:expansin
MYEGFQIVPATVFRWSLFFVLLIVFLGQAVPGVSGQDSYPNHLYLPIIAKPNSNPIRSGQATYYYATGAGSCMFDPSPSDLNVAAMNAADYNTAAVCGEYVHVKGPKGEITVRIVDLCPGCTSGDLDLSQQAFASIANIAQGRVNITWQVVSPDVSGPIVYHFKDGSNRWWTAVQIRNHRNPIAKFEYYSGSQWVTVARTSYNYFVQSSGMGPGPYKFRVTDIYGNILTDSDIQLLPDQSINGSGQFPNGP